jgi:NADH dehydrogenase FAD-containing subunit
MDLFKVVVCGGGVAGIEGLLRIHRLLGRSADLTLLCPNQDFDHLPLLATERSDRRFTRKFPVAGIVADTAATWIPDSLHWVDRDGQLVHTSGGRTLPYDALLLAPGGRQLPVEPHTDAFTASRGPSMYARLIEEIEAGRVKAWLLACWTDRTGRFPCMSWR